MTDPIERTPQPGIPERISVAMIGGLFLILLGQIVLRTFGMPLIWVEEFSVAAFIWLSFLGIAMGFRRGEHLAIDMVFDMTIRFLNARWVSAWRLALEALSFLFFLFFAVGLAIMAEKSWAIFAGSISGFRQGYIYLGVLVATAITLWELGKRIRVAVGDLADSGRKAGEAP